MTAVENTIAALKEDTSNLSGMGSILDNKTFGESQGYDALMIKLAPALMRAAKKTAKIEPRLKKIISLVSQRGYERIAPEDIEIRLARRNTDDGKRARGYCGEAFGDGLEQETGAYGGLRAKRRGRGQGDSAKGIGNAAYASNGLRRG